MALPLSGETTDTLARDREGHLALGETRGQADMPRNCTCIRWPLAPRRNNEPSASS